MEFQAVEAVYSFPKFQSRGKRSPASWWISCAKLLLLWSYNRRRAINSHIANDFENIMFPQFITHDQLIAVLCIASVFLLIQGGGIQGGIKIVL